eukprot:TRINITY_DN18607_c0_g1_i1.p1 TRINITY_DN18607_c0_g1~~TRINITY_DN18607_c0_g1_i1.p1  ORF type:complete len:347 (-),score=75.08 TRINITY_DN18607_c0_g1_i1:77-1018(-)
MAADGAGRLGAGCAPVPLEALRPPGEWEKQLGRLVFKAVEVPPFDSAEAPGDSSSSSLAATVRVVERRDEFADPNEIDVASGVRVWEGGLDLARHLAALPEEEALRLRGARALELGAGHGVPGIVAMRRYGAHVDFHDLNADVLREVTSANVAASAGDAASEGEPSAASPRARFLIGDWREVHALAGSCEELRYEAVLAAEAIYKADAYPDIAALLLRLLAPSTPSARGGVAWFAGKRFYFGCGGGTASFAAFLRERGFGVIVARVVEDGRSNVREILRIEPPAGAGSSKSDLAPAEPELAEAEPEAKRPRVS